MTRGDGPGGGSPRRHVTKLGDRVRIRRERWQISGADGGDDCRVLTLTGLGPANLHQRRHLLAPFEIIEPIDGSSSRRVRLVGRGRWRAACRRLLARSGGWTAIESAEAAHVGVFPHQLEPAIAVLNGRGCRVLLADAVGLGKTIEAALIVAELLARGAAARALLLTPAGLRDQWADELHQRFNQPAKVIDVSTARRLTARLPYGVNPWSTVPVAIASLDYVKRPEVLPAVGAKPWDIVLVDEAHLVAPGSDRAAAVSSLCAVAAFVILLTATPHSGDTGAFASLCAQGAHGDPLLVFRRSRADVKLGTARRVHRHSVRPTAEEARMHAALARYGAQVRQARGANDPTSGLLLSILNKRAWSSASSLTRSLDRRLSALAPSQSQGEGQLSLPLDNDGELDESDAPPDRALTTPALDDIDRERRLLIGIRDLSERAGLAESKQRTLGRLLARCRRRGERAIVFTEYRDTLLHLQRALGPESVVLHGGMNRWERRAALDTFSTGRSWLLLSTDAGSEGLNLHQTCRLVIHVELPWNPTRLEQRIGRVDRIGQTRPVHVWCLIARDTGEARLLDHLKSKVDRARLEIEVPNPLQSSAPEGGGTDAAGTGPTSVHLSPSGSQQVWLSAEAVMEAQRVSRARMLARGRPGVAIDSGSLVTVARGRLRAAVLGSKALLAVESTVQDTAGRRIGSRVDGLLIELTRRPPRRDAVRVAAALAASPQVAHTLSLTAEEEWIMRVTEQHASFWRTCLQRACAIRQVVAGERRMAFQPGLFDRRADRARQVTADEQSERLLYADQRCALCQHQLQTPASVVRTTFTLLP